MLSHSGVTRRGVLRAVAGAAAGVGLVGTAGATERTQPYIVVASGQGVAAARGRARPVRHEVPLPGGAVAVAGRFSPAAIAALERRRDVRYAEVDAPVYAIHHDRGGHAPGGGGPDGGESSQRLPWGVDRIDADVAAAAGYSGEGANVAVIDTGIDSNHPDLKPNLGVGVSFVPCRGGPKDCKQSWDDDNGHGTHCAGTVAAVDDDGGVVGVAPGATLHAVKVLDKNGAGRYSDIIAGIHWVLEAGYDVASMSLGGSSASRSLGEKCAEAAAAGVALVAAAGNDYGGSVSYPAAYPSVVAVSATDSSDDLAGFSNVGEEIDLAAPGVGVESTWLGGGYNSISGTSMACPHVAGSVAQLMAAGYTSSEARSRLQATAEAVGLTATQGGAGLVDVAAALGLDSSDN